MITRYRKRIYGPFLDRIDIHIEVPRVDYDKLSGDRLGEPSKVIRQRVEAAREIQHARFEGKGLTCNADMGVAEVREFCGVGTEGRSLLRAAMTQLRLCPFVTVQAYLDRVGGIGAHHDEGWTKIIILEVEVVVVIAVTGKSFATRRRLGGLRRSFASRT